MAVRSSRRTGPSNQLSLTLTPAQPQERALELASALPSSQVNPAGLYLATLAPGPSRDTMRNGLARIVEHLAPALAQAYGREAVGRFPWWTLRYEHLLVLREQLRARYRRRTANLYLQAVRGVLAQAHLQGELSTEHFERARAVKLVGGHEAPCGRALGRDELTALVGSLSDDGFGARDGALLALLGCAGLRRAEVVALDVEDCARDRVHVRGKGLRERLVPLVGDAASALTAWRRVRDETLDPASGPLVVPLAPGGRPLGRRMSARAVGKRLAVLAKRAGVPHLSPHDLRRTFATESFRCGIDGGLIKRMMGHARFETTLTYDRRDVEDAAEALARVDLPAQAGRG